jgi:K+-sensing histidine kinase KdpD
MARFFRWADVFHALVALTAVAAVTFVHRVWLRQSTNTTTVALTYVLLVLFVAAGSRLWVAVTTSFAAMFAFNFFFLPPIGTFTIIDPQNWVALFAFLGVSLVASQLSAVARERATIAIERAQLDLKSTLLSSLAHDLRTPLTAIRVATSNLTASWLDEAQRAEQSAIVMG